MNILVIRFSSLGDVILTTPVFSYLKRRFPDSTITFLTDKNYVDLFSDDPRLKSVLGFHKSDNVDKLSIINEVWDFVVDLQNSPRSQLIFKSIKKKKSTGVFAKFHIKRLLLILTKINFYPAQSNVITRYLRAAGMVESTINIEKSPNLFFKPPSSSQYDRLIQSDTIIRPTIALFPFSAWKNKEWPVKYFMMVGKFFISKGWNVIIMGSRSEKENADQLRLLIGSRAISLAGQLSLYECGCVLSRCTVALGNDSGLSHLARACGVKTGIIYGPTTYHFGFYPSGNPPFKVFETPMHCRPCHPHGGNVCWRFNHDCMKNINPEIVIKGLINMLE